MPAHERLTAAIVAANDSGRPALVPFITAGYPEPGEFINTLKLVASVGDAVEIGIPFSDPMADGMTIQRSSHAALREGVSLKWIFSELEMAGVLHTPLVQGAEEDWVVHTTQALVFGLHANVRPVHARTEQLPVHFAVDIVEENHVGPRGPRRRADLLVQALAVVDVQGRTDHGRHARGEAALPAVLAVRVHEHDRELGQPGPPHHEAQDHLQQLFVGLGRAQV